MAVGPRFAEGDAFLRLEAALGSCASGYTVS
jgi:hypothetical protein